MQVEWMQEVKILIRGMNIEIKRRNSKIQKNGQNQSQRNAMKSPKSQGYFSLTPVIEEYIKNVWTFNGIYDT